MPERKASATGTYLQDALQLLQELHGRSRVAAGRKEPGVVQGGVPSARHAVRQTLQSSLHLTDALCSAFQEKYLQFPGHGIFNLKALLGDGVLWTPPATMACRSSSFAT